MTIIQQPDALSFSQNLKKFIISSVDVVTFVLKKGNQELVSQRYTAGDTKLIEIDITDIVHDALSYELKESDIVYEQANLAADFTAIIDATTITIRVVRGGVDRLQDPATVFLKQNWLTWQPTEKKVTYYSPEFLTYYATEACVVKLKAYFSATDQQDIVLAQLAAGKAYTIPLQYALIAGKCNGKYPCMYDVWVESPTGQRWSYVQRYCADSAQSQHEDWILFENSLGGLDCFRAYGERTLDARHTHHIAEQEHTSNEYRVDTEHIYTKHTGYLTRVERRWLLDFLPSLGKYIYDQLTIRRITVTESTSKVNDEYKPVGYTFSFRFADQRTLLNLPRTEVKPDVLHMEFPAAGNFSLPPRLSEIARQPLSEGVLIPVQDPYSEVWGTTTVGALAKKIGELLGLPAGTIA